MLIVLEGIDGCGKSTTAELLRNALGHDVAEIIHFPSSWVSAQLERGMGEEASLVLLADMREVLNKRIIPELEKGKTVICDRAYLSTFAYQFTRFMKHTPFWGSLSVLYDDVKQQFEQNFVITFYLDIPVEEAIKRVQARNSEKSRFENEAHKIWAARVSSYRSLFKKGKEDGHSYHTLDVHEKTPFQILDMVLKVLMKESI